MSNLEANLRSRLPKSRKDLKPNASLFPPRLARVVPHIPPRYGLTRSTPCSAHMPFTQSSWSCTSTAQASHAPSDQETRLTQPSSRSGWIAPPVAVLVRFGVGWDL